MPREGEGHGKGPIIVKTMEKPKWDGKVTEETIDGWVLHEKDRTVSIKPKWGGSHMEVTDERKDTHVTKEISIAGVNRFYETGHDWTLRVDGITIASPYAKEPRRIGVNKESQGGLAYTLESNLGFSSEQIKGEISSEDGTVTIKFGKPLKVTHLELATHLTGDEVHKAKQERLITTEVFFSGEFEADRAVYKVEDITGKFRVPPLLRHGMILKPGVSVDGVFTKLLEEHIDSAAEKEKMAQFLKEPGVMERTKKIVDEGKKREDELKKRAQA